MFHVDEAVYNKDKGRIESEKLKPVARMGGVTYTTLGNMFDIPRPTTTKEVK